MGRKNVEVVDLDELETPKVENELPEVVSDDMDDASYFQNQWVFSFLLSFFLTSLSFRISEFFLCSH